MSNTTLPTDSEARKQIPLLGGCLRYFPAALAGVAKHSKAGNDKHNPGQPLHHARGKSMDHGECIARHLLDVQDLEALLAGPDVKLPLDQQVVSALLSEANALCWRALAFSQELHERLAGAPLAPGAVQPVAAEVQPRLHPVQFRIKRLNDGYLTKRVDEAIVFKHDAKHAKLFSRSEGQAWILAREAPEWFTLEEHI